MNRRELIFALSAFATTPARADVPRRYALLYPDLPDPERVVFRQIREGLASTIGRAGGLLTEHALSTTVNYEVVSTAIEADRPDVLITLGRTATMLARQVQPSVPWLTGAAELPVPTPDLGGISLFVNPDRVFETLGEVAPRVNRVSVVMQPSRFGWLRTHIERAARSRSFQVMIYDSTTIAEAAAHYLNIIRYGNPRTDSLWLLEQGQFVTADTLPRIIEESWAKEFLVFSSVLEHVSEGSLFALYMNPTTLGTRLGKLALASRGRPPPLALDNAPARAINLRTARHLSNIVDAGTLKSFDLTLGER